MRVVVLGGTGYLGQYVVRELLAHHHHVRGVSRRMPAGGELEWVQGDFRNLQLATRALRDMDALIHLVGIIRPQGEDTYLSIHVDGTAIWRRAAQEAGLKRYIYVSALGAGNFPRLRYAYSKWQAENLIKESPVPWTIFRPSLLFGPGGQAFLERLVQSLEVAPRRIAPLPAGGKTRYQPLYAGDLARAIVISLERDDEGKTFSLGGPEHLSYRQVLERILQVLGERRILVPVPASLLTPGVW
ncbi:MAG: NAD(P)H-binding protein, partial [Bacillota bacterium]|nr:NAD(P)H-binding protein [Bacillota bacterium]